MPISATAGNKEEEVSESQVGGKGSETGGGRGRGDKEAENTYWHTILKLRRYL